MPRLGLYLRHAAITLLALVLVLILASRFFVFDIALGNLVLRAQRGGTHPLPPPALPTAAEWVPSPGEPRPRNVILFIGDGMGLGHVAAASALLGGPASTLAMERTPHVGLMRTWALDDLVTDSAASSTAMATGAKTLNKAIGLHPEGHALRNILEAARAAGLATGVITTSGLVDATMAAFTAHVASRRDYAEILAQMLESGTDLMLGGDWLRYSKAKKNKGYRELLDRAGDLATERGYNVIREPEALREASAPLLGLFPARLERTEDYGPPLAASTARAIELLAVNPRGFFLVVESEVTDVWSHETDIGGMIDGVRELDEAVALALRRTAPAGDTLILVTADHDTGGLALVDGPFQDRRAVVRWASDTHSSEWVPIFAFGPSATAFTGVLDNTDLAKRFARLLDLESLPRLAEARGS